MLTTGVDQTEGAVSADNGTAEGSTGSVPLEGSITSIAPGDMLNIVIDLEV